MYNNDHRPPKNTGNEKLSLVLLLCVLAMILLALFLLSSASRKSEPDQTEAGKEPAIESTTETVVTTSTVENTPVPTPTPVPEKPKIHEEDIYTFLQGPYSWSIQADWSGAWCAEILGGQEFSIFGCGLCAMANIYSTLTDCDCSPVDMFHYAKEVSTYAPVSNYGAIDWNQMRDTLRTTGITSVLKKKDKTYEQFQKEISEGITAIALVSNNNSKIYWDYTSGHYVNIWLYNSEDDTVMVADSGNPDHNRQRIPLSYVYESLCTSSNYQYMLVTSADKNANTWKHDGIRENWKVPSYYKGIDYTYLFITPSPVPSAGAASPSEITPAAVLPLETPSGAASSSETTPAAALPLEAPSEAASSSETTPAAALPLEAPSGAASLSETTPAAALPLETSSGAASSSETTPAAAMPLETTPGAALPVESSPSGSE